MFFLCQKGGMECEVAGKHGVGMQWCGKRGGSVRSQAEQEWGCILKKEGGSLRLLVQILDCSLRS